MLAAGCRASIFFAETATGSDTTASAGLEEPFLKAQLTTLKAHLSALRVAKDAKQNCANAKHVCDPS